MPASPPDTLSLSSMKVILLQDQCTIVWHQETPAVLPALTGLERAVTEQHLANFELWHAEDSARTPQASDHDIARTKRFIDSANQRRNDLTEQCDILLLKFLNQQNLPAPGAELH